MSVEKDEWLHNSKMEKVRNDMLEETTIYDVADFFKLFGDSTRIRILLALDSSELSVGELSEVLGMTMSAVSHQLKILKDAYLVKPRRDGKNIFYSLCDEHVKFILEMALEHMIEGREI